MVRIWQMYVDELKKCLTEQTFAENKIIALYLFAFLCKICAI